MTPLSRRALAALAPLSAVAFAACGADRSPTEPGTGPPPPQPGVRALAGAAVDDTILTQPLQALVVEVRGPNGALAPHVTVRFDARPPADTTRRLERSVYLCTLASAGCGPALTPFGPGNDSQFAADTTDASGRAKAIVRLGTVAGAARVVVSVPELALRDSITFTVRPGALTRVRFATRDTMVTIGASVPLRATARDRFSNTRSDPLTFASSDPGATVDAQGTATVRAGGRFAVVARAGQVVDTAYVSAVPPGRLVAWGASDYPTPGIVSVGTDGSGLRRLTPASNSYGVMPSWSPSGARVVYLNTGQLMVADTLGGAPVNVSAPVTSAVYTGRFVGEAEVEFIGRRQDGSIAVYRGPAGPGGSGTLRQIAAPIDLGTSPFGGADIRADGAQIVYADASANLRVFDVAAATSRSLGVRGSTPRWSPAGDVIAYSTATSYGANGTLRVVHADGTGVREVSSESISSGIAWSPDGAWLAVRTYYNSVILVRASDGNTMPLRYTVDLYQPSWR